MTGFLHLLEGVRRLGRGRVVYAATSATYGDDPAEVKREDTIGAPLSPYALSKTMNELLAELYARAYGVEALGLRYFNVFGARQDPAGAYAAVIPAWIERLLAGHRCVIHGDGETTRDFCHVDEVVQANLLAAMLAYGARFGRVYNGARTEFRFQPVVGLKEGLARTVTWFLRRGGAPSQ